MKFNKIFSIVTNVFVVFLVVYGLACSFTASFIEDKLSIEYLRMVMFAHQAIMEGFAIMTLEVLLTLYKAISKLVSIWNMLLTQSPDQSSSEEKSAEEKKD